MACSGRVKQKDIRPEQKWDFISLQDFKSTSCFTPLAYGYLWLNLFISLAVYGVDTFTAVNLLAFDKWSSTIQPGIPLKISKWIFSICIIASWVNLGFEYLRAFRVINRGAVAESYLDSLAVRIQSTRMGQNGLGWRRFLVFAELTKSKKGAEYVALFTYFAFQSWIRVIFCSGPRQVINAVTLYSVFVAKLDPTGSTDVGSALLQFFKNIGILASENYQQAAILGGMVFTLIIWILASLSLILATLFYICFLWHYIPSADGGLSGYCERKINSRLQKIVSVKINKALADEERRNQKAAEKAAAKAAKKGEKPVVQGRQATLPTLLDPKSDDKLPNMPTLNRTDTFSTLPQYSSRPGTPSGQPTIPTFELDQLDQKRPFPSRTATGASNMSNVSYASNAPLMSNASDMGYGRSASPVPSLPPLDTNSTGPQRTMTGSSNNSQWSRGPVPQPPRMPSAMGREYTASPVSYSDSPNGRNTPGMNGIPRQPSVDSFGRPMPRAIGELGGRSMTPVSEGRYSPAPGSQMGRASPGPYSPQFPGPNPPNTYTPYNPNMRSASAAPQQNPTSVPQPYRNMTDPGMRGPPTNGGYFGDEPLPMPQRPGTAQSQRSMAGGPPAVNYYGNEPLPMPQRPGTAQSQQSMASGPPAAEHYSNEPLPMPQRPGTAQSQRSMAGAPYGGQQSTRGPPGPPRMGSPASFDGRPGQQGGYRQ
ncbi:hypothetical protein BP5796_03863 [Coleophoma crateriformis]|uniref:Vacuolar membrane protein n=1 Tax=Coleophoma crateriformis TaxID=565419 RepID=A0A3D8SID0_9HELO|nr:hypothetical protein BP5796_03863 [Coleophoma crateriformis]